jgi:hypothetical protein
MKDTKLVDVFVSCPGDLSEEKDIVKEVCKSINNTLEKSGIHVSFNVYDWQDIVGELGWRPQDYINKIFSDYDIYIGMLWMRFGTPTGAINPDTGKPYESGTEEEFTLAIKKQGDGEKIKIHLFFKDPRGPRDKKETEQLTKVFEFKDKVKLLGILNTIPKKKKNYKFNNNIHAILHEFARKVESEIQTIKKTEYFSKPLATKRTHDLIDVTKFVKHAPKIDLPIPRSLVPYREVKDLALEYFDENNDEKLVEVIKDNRRVVVLGGAGSGKSTELGYLAHLFATMESPYIPIYSRLNTYVDEPIDEFLPAGWKEIPEINALIILDGLDEVQPQHFNTAVRKILTFSDSYPELRLVISCRTNFYDFPDKVLGGTLNGFKLYFIKDISGNNLNAYAEQNYNVSAEEFIKAAYYEGYSELIRQPFFLKLLLSEFQQNGNLKINRAELMTKFIDERIKFDQAHFKLTTKLGDKKFHIFSLLQRLALTLEYLGRNYLLYDELLKVIPDNNDIQLIKFSTAFKNIESDTQKWGFEHNNIQEFMAANALKDLKIDKIKSFLSFKNKRIKPSWVNTLFFLMSIISTEKREKLIQWILDIEPEVLIKIEPDKIEPETRYQIFERVFNYYKNQKVWLRSNKFTERELALFAPVDKAFVFLVTELKNTYNEHITRLNAMSLLKFIPLDNKQREVARNIILGFIEANQKNQYLFKNASFALTLLDRVDKAMIEQLMELFGKRSNQYIRSGLYQLIIHAGLVDDYIDYFIDGMSGVYQSNELRESVNLIDENILLQEGLAKVRTVESMEKLLGLFKDPFDSRVISLYEKNDYIQKIIESAIQVYKTNPSVEVLVYDIFLGYAKVSEERIAEIIAEFFTSIGKRQTTFERIFMNRNIQSFDKSILLKPLLDEKAVDFVMEAFKKRDINNAELWEFYSYVYWLKNRLNKETVIDYLTSQIDEKTNLFKEKNQKDFNQLRNERKQVSFNLFFSKPDFVQGVKEFFNNIGRNELTYEELWAHNSRDITEEPHMPDAIFNYLIEFTRDRKNVKLQEALNWLNEPYADLYLFSNIKDGLSNNTVLKVSDEQKEVIIKWVQDTVIKTDIAGAIETDVARPNFISLNKSAIILWYFITKFNISINKDKILDFTLFDELKYNDEKGIDFSVIENQVSKERVAFRVLENLTNGISYDNSWRNNANYALEYNIHKAYPIVLKNLGDYTKSVYVRLKVLKNYIDKTQDYKGLMELLKQIGMDDFHWGVVDNLKEDLSVHSDLIVYLERILKLENYPIEQKVRASQYLTEKNVESGTIFFLKHLIATANPAKDYYHESMYIRTIQNIKYLPKLIELLILANRPEYTADNFNRFDGTVSDAIYNLGLQSEENLYAVKEALQKFIIENVGTIPNINFYYPMIDRMEYQYYLIQSQSGDVNDAIREVAKLNF